MEITQEIFNQIYLEAQQEALLHPGSDEMTILEQMLEDYSKDD